MNRIMIAGTNSGCGKTTVTCALLTALKARGLSPVAFKSGPDYVDPMFHRAVTGIPAYNLDPFFLDGGGLRSHLASRAGRISVVEGAMGYYDGIAATCEASAYTVSRETRTPVILVVGARGAAYSLAAAIDGFVKFRPDSNIAGVVFNFASESRYSDLEKTAGAAGVRAYGTLPENAGWAFQGRRLGLLTAGEIEDLQDKLAKLGCQAERSLDIDGLITAAEIAPEFIGQSDETQTRADLPGMNPVKSRLPNGQKSGAAESHARRSAVRVAVAKDEAFCFIYEENLEMLRSLGCEPTFFSPLRDGKLPDNIDGLYLCGGYPDLHAETLAANVSMRNGVKRAVDNGLPVIAESGGFMYLHDSLGGYPMCGVIKGEAYDAQKLRRFGYITLTADVDNMLCKAGGSIRAHEFHYWDSTNPGGGFTAKKAGRDISYACVHASDALYAGFPHLYFPANPEFAKNFVEKMTRGY